ncbi:hypothetical protein PSTT_13987, partial [Puccinia striiformis]
HQHIPQPALHQPQATITIDGSVDQDHTYHKQPTTYNTMLSRALLSLAGCLLAVSMVASQGAAPDTGIRYLCNANRQRVGARKSDGSVARVDTKGVPTTPFSGFCNCLSGGLACPHHPTTTCSQKPSCARRAITQLRYNFSNFNESNSNEESTQLSFEIPSKVKIGKSPRQQETRVQC